MLDKIYYLVEKYIAFIDQVLFSEDEDLIGSLLPLCRLCMEWLAYSMIVACCDEIMSGVYKDLLDDYNYTGHIKLPRTISRDFLNLVGKVKAVNKSDDGIKELLWFVNNFLVVDRLGKSEQYRYRLSDNNTCTQCNNAFQILKISFSFVKLFNKYSQEGGLPSLRKEFLISNYVIPDYRQI